MQVFDILCSREVLGLAVGLGLTEVATVCRCIIKRNINSTTVLTLQIILH